MNIQKINKEEILFKLKKNSRWNLFRIINVQFQIHGYLTYLKIEIGRGNKSYRLCTSYHFTNIAPDWNLKLYCSLIDGNVIKVSTSKKVDISKAYVIGIESMYF